MTCGYTVVCVFGYCLCIYGTGAVDVVCIHGSWVCSFTAPCVQYTQTCLYLGALFVYIMRPVGVVCICGGLVGPQCGVLYGAFCVVWVLRSVHAWGCSLYVYMGLCVQIGRVGIACMCRGRARPGD